MNYSSSIRHSPESGNPAASHFLLQGRSGTPAFAGMTLLDFVAALHIQTALCQGASISLWAAIDENSPVDHHHQTAFRIGCPNERPRLCRGRHGIDAGEPLLARPLPVADRQ